jgi:hypothetical protein
LLNNFAALAVEEIERNKPLYEIAVSAATNDVERNRHLDLSVTAYKEGVIMLDVREAGWPISYANPAFETSSGLELDDLAGNDFWNLFQCPGQEDLDLPAIIGNGNMFEAEFFCSMSKRWLTLNLMPATTDRFASSKATGIPSWVPSVDAPKGSKLGLDVDDDKIVDVVERDVMDVQDAKCFWFAVVRSSSFGSDVGSTQPSSGQTSSTQSGSQNSSNRSASICSFRSGFGEYTPPTSLGKLQLGPLLGSGSFGKVYRSVADDGKIVAVKVIDCRGREGGATSSQLDEVKLTRDLDHPHVIKMLNHGDSTEKRGESELMIAWIVQEYCDMGHLLDAAERGWLRVARKISAPPDMAVVLAVLHDIASAMSYVHSKSVLHADLTCRNGLLTSSADDARGFKAKVGDFGLSRITKDGEIVPTNVLGTITHLPPEAFTEKTLSLLTDVWAFGIIAWETYYGKKVYCGKLPPQIIMTVVKNIPLEWSQAPQEFVSLMSQILEYDRDKRPKFPSILNELDALIALKLEVAIEPSEHLMKLAPNYNP